MKNTIAILSLIVLCGCASDPETGMSGIQKAAYVLSCTGGACPALPDSAIKAKAEQQTKEICSKSKKKQDCIEKMYPQVYSTLIQNNVALQREYALNQLERDSLRNAPLQNAPSYTCRASMIGSSLNCNPH